MKEASNKIHFPDLEAEILKFWREGYIFQKTIEQRPTDRSFVFYDGPPFATGLPHYGHLLAGTIKDVIPRYKTMRNFRVERRFGWDTHGLPVEYEVEQDLKLNGAREVREYGVARFNDACRSIVLRYTSEWRETVDRMARWVDFEHDYKTMDRDFMESVWWVFKQLWEKDLIYEGLKVVPYSWRVATPLSNFEANLNYKDIQDPSVTLRFRIAGEDDSFFLAWTTTPWTLPSNMALCAGPELEYVKLRVTESGECYYLVASRVDAFFEAGSYTILSSMKGTELQGMAYEPLFDFARGQVSTERAWQVYLDDYVSDESGTGLVHLACFGEDDVRIFQREGIPVFDPVDDEGNFLEYMGFIAGLNVMEANKPITRQLKAEGKLFHHETVQHSYPFCWRTDTPLIYRPISTWFLNVEAIKDRMVGHNRNVHWVPGHIRDGRFGKWLENARDWAISRNRFWGTPLPIWKSDDGDTLCFGSVEELEAATGTTVPDLHKQFVDDLTVTHRGKTYRRIPEVLDCWFESGSMPYAQQHYPFENKELFESNFPADFICEGLDQTRGWFYTLVVIAAALFDTPAFHNCVVNGLVLAEDGKKMSKRLKNYPDPVDMLDRFGADAIRLYMLNSPAVRGEDLRFSEKGLVETTRNLLLPLWNALAFLTTYAKIDGWEPSVENLSVHRRHPLDRWILSRLKQLVDEVREQMDQYNLNRSVAPFVGFIDLLTNWYIRRSRRRFWSASPSPGGEGGPRYLSGVEGSGVEGSGVEARYLSGVEGEDKLEAYATLYQVLKELSKVIAPFVPFIADGIFQTLRNAKDPESVHLALFPEEASEEASVPSPGGEGGPRYLSGVEGSGVEGSGVEGSGVEGSGVEGGEGKSLVRDLDLEQRMELVLSTVNMGRALRAKHQLKIRQPLPKVVIISHDREAVRVLEDLGELITEELNVKEVEITAEERGLVNLSAKANFKLLGRKLGKKMKAASGTIASLKPDAIELFQQQGFLELNVEGEPMRFEGDEILIQRDRKEGLLVETDNTLTLALETELSDELLQEGLAREFINKVQNMRKEQDLDVMDRIITRYHGSGRVRQSLESHAKFIRMETLSRHLQAEDLMDGNEWDLNGEPCRISIERAA